MTSANFMELYNGYDESEQLCIELRKCDKHTELNERSQEKSALIHHKSNMTQAHD